jgi:basic membrane protein A
VHLHRWAGHSMPYLEANKNREMFMKIRSLFLGAATALGFATTSIAADVKVGFVYVGPVGDGGWTYEHDQGRLAVEEAFGDRVETIYQEMVPEGADSERVMTQMALQGADLIFTTSFGYMDPTINVAQKFPNVKFEHATGYKRADNVSTYSARFYEGRAIQGHIAGKMTKSNIIGYIGSFPIPEVIRGINSAYIHAKRVNPDVEFKIIWVYTWFDPAKEADAATALIEQGADVVLQHTDSTAPQAAAEKAGNVITFGRRPCTCWSCRANTTPTLANSHLLLRPRPQRCCRRRRRWPRTKVWAMPTVSCSTPAPAPDKRCFTSTLT